MPEDRVRARRADGHRLRLHRADRSRRHRPRGDPRGARRRRPSPKASASSIPTTPSTSSKTCRRRSRRKSSSSCRRPSASRSTRSLDYPEDSAGRRMQTEFIAVPPSWTVGQAIDYMRETADLPERFYELYVVDPGQALARRGAARPAAAHQAAGADLRTDRRGPPPRRARPTTRRRWRACSSATTWSRRRWSTTTDRLVGVITVDDIVDVIEEEADEDIKALGGVDQRRGAVRHGLDHRARAASTGCWSIWRPRSSPPRCSACSRASCRRWWRSRCWRRSSRARAAMPTTQTMTVAVRALATRELGAANAWRVIMRELLVGLVNGIAFAVITGIAALPGSRSRASASSSGSR